MGIYDTGNFPWASDIGASSIDQMEKLAMSSGVEFSMSSGFRPGDPGYHGSMNAVDLVSTTASMDKLAGYLYQYSPYLLELIHSDMSQQGGGWFVKNGQRVDAAFYGASTVSQHYNHVHVATTLSALAAASQGAMTIPATATEKVKGCLTPAATVLMLISSLGGLLWMIH